jgi:hypothetical protein
MLRVIAEVIHHYVSYLSDFTLPEASRLASKRADVDC